MRRCMMSIYKLATSRISKISMQSELHEQGFVLQRATTFAAPPRTVRLCVAKTARYPHQSSATWCLWALLPSKSSACLRMLSGTVLRNGEERFLLCNYVKMPAGTCVSDYLLLFKFSLFPNQWRKKTSLSGDLLIDSKRFPAARGSTWWPTGWGGCRCYLQPLDECRVEEMPFQAISGSLDCEIASWQGVQGNAHVLTKTMCSALLRWNEAKLSAMMSARLYFPM